MGASDIFTSSSRRKKGGPVPGQFIESIKNCK